MSEPSILDDALTAGLAAIEVQCWRCGHTARASTFSRIGVVLWAEQPAAGVGLACPACGACFPLTVPLAVDVWLSATREQEEAT